MRAARLALAAAAPLAVALPAAAEGPHDLTMTRILDAPVERVWDAWTSPKAVMAWWGPTGFTAPVADMEVREGGTSLVCMRPPGGPDLCNTWTYERIVPLERMEFAFGFVDADGNPAAPAALGLPAEIPATVPHVVTFRALDGGQTELTVAEYGYGSPEIVELSKAGLGQTLDKLAAWLAGGG